MPGFVSASRAGLLAMLSAVLVPAGTAAAQIEEVPLIEAAEMPALEQRQVPNIVVVLADDAAFTDFGAYGGEIATPVIDGLAATGVQFTNFHTVAMGAPSRAMLLTGLDSHEAGVATDPLMAPEDYEGEPGYRGQLEGGVRTVASLLQEVGYRTYAVGKWQLGAEPEHLPPAHGFDRSFVAAAGSDHFGERAAHPLHQGVGWVEDGESATLPDDFYASENLIDQVISYIGDGSDEAPFFAYVAFTAPHYPLQAPGERVESYLDRYTEGWHALREERWLRAKELGVVPPDAPLGTFVPGARDWDDLTGAERANYARRMAAYAGMIDSLDAHLGRLVEHLKSTGQFENTVFVFASDNGPAGVEHEADPDFRRWASAKGYAFGTDRIGTSQGFATLGPEWASAAASPGNLFKGYLSEGGTRVPLVVAGPGIEPGVKSRALSVMSDITPTILDLANAPFDREALTGRSLTPILLGAADRVYGPLDAIGLELNGNAALFRGSYKIVRNNPPGSDGEWRLFNIDEDPGETLDLSFASPQLFEDMLSDYSLYERWVGVRPMPEGYDPAAVARERVNERLSKGQWWRPFAGLLLVVGGVFLLWQFLIRGFITNLLSSKGN
ncbi:MAG: arylsulfatase [Pseudomonadota bacterium]